MAGKVLTIAQQKGGAGKTTIAAHLAVALAAGGARVVLVDIDPQQSLAMWHGLREKAMGPGRTGLEFAAIAGWRATAQLDRLKQEADFVIVDSPPHAETEARIVVRAADLVILPIQPSPMDMWAIRPTLDIAKQEKVPVLAVFNRMPPRGVLADAMMAQAKELGLPLAETTLGNRVGYAASLFAGRAVGETEPKSPAAEEIAALAREIAAVLAKAA